MLNKKALAGTPSTPPAYVEDVFSTYLYSGTGATQTITNNIDLSGDGGLTWIKARTQPSFACDNVLFDTTRGALKYLRSNTTDAEYSSSNSLTSFNNNGFSLGTDSTNGQVNWSGHTYCSWTFRKQAKFFDVVTYTGNETDRTITHNLGSVPGMIILKRTDAAGDWFVYHRSLANTQYLRLNFSQAAGTSTALWNSTTPTSSVFSLGGATSMNLSGATYVAYLFAHDAGGFGAAGTDNVISCGSFTTNGSGVATVNLGYEPQYVMIKASSTAGDWLVEDVMRGLSQTGEQQLFANSSAGESANGSPNDITINATGFTTANSNVIGNSRTYIYMAIRRPMKTPTSGTEVFSPVARTGTGATAIVTTGFAPDLVTIQRRGGGGDAAFWFDRLRGFPKRLRSDGTSAETSPTDEMLSMNNTDFVLGTDTSASVNYSTFTYANWAFRRAPGFFDVVCYTGGGSKNHNLGVVPELVIAKRRDGTNAWQVAVPSGTAGEFFVGTSSAPIGLNTTNGNGGEPSYPWSSYADSTTFNPGGIFWDAVTGNNVAYLFATCAGVSKVGSYTGTGSTQTINCGFTAGARFVLIKRTDSTGDWYVWDTARGIVSGNDPYLLLNSTAAEVTNTDYIDPVNSGFEISSTAPAAINANGGSFIFLAIS